MATNKAMAFELVSSVVKNNEFMSSAQVHPKCGGENISPDLLWKNIPVDAKSLALVVHDPDAPRPGGFYHWIVVDIPAATTGLEMGMRVKSPAIEVATDFGTPGYNGPCPPVGHSAHRYHFTIHALDVKKINLSPGLSPAAVESVIKSHTIESATITGLYERK